MMSDSRTTDRGADSAWTVALLVRPVGVGGRRDPTSLSVARFPFQDKSADGHMARLLWGCVVVMALISLSGCASSSLGRGLNVGVVGSGIADVASSQGGIEGNPLMSNRVEQQIAVKGFGIGAVLGAAWWLDQKQHPLLAQVVRGIAFGAWTAATIHNVVRVR